MLGNFVTVQVRLFLASPVIYSMHSRSESTSGRTFLVKLFLGVCLEAFQHHVMHNNLNADIVNYYRG